MPIEIDVSEFEYPSFDGTSTIHAMTWIPSGNVVGVLQMIHGMSEHIERYDAFARFMAEHGFVVCGHDHIGHGKSVSSKDDLGHMPIDRGADALVEDVDTLRLIMQEAYGESLPYFIFGHSMGSFVLRVYLTRHASGLSGAILCGTGQQPRIASLAGNALARVGTLVSGERKQSKLIHSLADGAFSRAIKDARTEFDWISADPDNVDDYIADELNGFPFTLGGYVALTSLTRTAADLRAAKRIPSDLPLLFIAGSEDPVGDCGRGVHAAADMVRTAGVHDVEVILYDGMRHEILNEREKSSVFEDVLVWMQGCI